MRKPVLVLALFSWVAIASAARADEIDDFVQAQMQRQRIPGLALVVLRDGMVVRTQGYGVADRQRQTAVTPETIFKIGSVSKQFIATGIMLLVQDGRLSLNDPI